MSSTHIARHADVTSADRPESHNSDQWHDISRQSWHERVVPKVQGDHSDKLVFLPPRQFSDDHQSEDQHLVIPDINNRMLATDVIKQSDQGKSTNADRFTQRGTTDYVRKIDIVEADQASKVKPDFVVRQDGTMEVLNNPAFNNKSKLVVAVQDGDKGKLNSSEQHCLDSLVTYLTKYMAGNEHKNVSGVIEDSNDFVSQSVKEKIDPVQGGSSSGLDFSSTDGSNQNRSNQADSNQSQSNQNQSSGSERPSYSQVPQPNDTNSSGVSSSGDQSSGGNNSVADNFNPLLQWLQELGLLDGNPDFSKLEKLQKSGKLSAKTVQMIEHNLPHLQQMAKSGHANSNSEKLPHDMQKLLDGTKGDTKIASELVRDAIKSAEQINTKGLCLKGVADALDMAGLGNIHSPAAYMAGDKLAKNPHFQEVSKNTNLQPGDIVVHGPASGNPYGHILVYLGHDKEASSKIANLTNMNYGAWTRVFRPVA